MLQVLLQPVIENLLIADRLEYLYEQGFDSATTLPVFCDKLSPRNHAIVAEKHSVLDNWEQRINRLI